MSWVGWFVRWFLMPMVPVLALVAYTGFQLDGQFEDMFRSASATVLQEPGAQARMIEDVERIGDLETATIEALVETDAFRAAVSEGQGRVGAAWDAGEDAPLILDLTDAIMEADLEPATAQALLASPVIEGELIERPEIDFRQVGWIAAFSAFSFAGLSLLTGRARQTTLYAMSMLALYAPFYLWGLYRVARADDVAAGAIGGWLQSRLGFGLVVATLLGLACFIVAERDRRGGDHLDVVGAPA